MRVVRIVAILAWINWFLMAWLVVLTPVVMTYNFAPAYVSLVVFLVFAILATMIEDGQGK